MGRATAEVRALPQEPAVRAAAPAKTSAAKPGPDACRRHAQTAAQLAAGDEVLLDAEHSHLPSRSEPLAALPAPVGPLPGPHPPCAAHCARNAPPRPHRDTRRVFPEPDVERRCLRCPAWAATRRRGRGIVGAH